MTESNREFFRLTYPRSGRPEFIVKGRPFPIVEISENGLRIKLPPVEKESWPIQETVQGRVRFSDGVAFNVVGMIVRHEETGDETQCTLSLSEGIPYARIVAEQRFMLQIFPMARKPE